MMRRGLATLLLPLLCGCTYFSGDPFVVVTSHPAGAEIFLDGEATGETTPAKLNLGGMFADDHEITVRKEGFDDETRHVYHYTTTYSTRFIDAATEIELLNNPVYWTFGDFFIPFGVRWRFVPHELYVVLYEEGTAPVKSVGGVMPTTDR